ncbi:hypothetical protein CCR75_009393 [Bremia lactucae]|uniref:Uncharacterized protein n=1 Tax=Bremia lactucae TaxID=4779 RepID=A0A976FIH5_BRELC|nr:hypothetical protein CCR75_009393 [Bremia lactucae]
MSLFSAMADDSSVWAQGSSLFNLSSPLNDLLEKDIFTLEQVLQEDELVQEVKTRNTKLIDFLSQEATVLELVNYVVRTSEDPTDAVRTLKYPYMSCEVICCDITSITETLVSASNGFLIETLFTLVYQSTPLNPRLAGYFEKIMTMLMVRKPHEMTMLLNKHSAQLLRGFTHHIASFSIAELLKRLLQPYQNDYMDDCMEFPGLSLNGPSPPSWCGNEDDEGMSGSETQTTPKNKTLTWQSDPLVVDLVLDIVADSHAENDAQTHAAEVLVDIIHSGSQIQSTEPTSPVSSSAPVSFVLLEYLESQRMVEKLVSLAVPSNDTSLTGKSSMLGAMAILSALLSRATNAQYTCATEIVPPVVACLVEKMPDLCEVLTASNLDIETIRNQRHEQVPRLGFRRLKTVHVVGLLVQSKYHAVDQAFQAYPVISCCLDLFFQFELVNLLHTEVETMVVGILESGSIELVRRLVHDGRLLARILDAYEENDRVMAVAKGFSLGYMGHLHRMCNMILTMLDELRSSTNEEGSLNDMRHADTVLELFEADDVTWKKWEDMSTNVLAPLYEAERLPLGGVMLPLESDDPYSVMGFNQNDELLNAQFAEMLGASGFDAENTNGFETEVDGKFTDTPMLPEIMNDSSSSEEEDEDEVGRHESPSRNNIKEGSTDRWARFESGGTWATFDTTFEDISFEPIPGMETDESEEEEGSTTNVVVTMEVDNGAKEELQSEMEEVDAVENESKKTAL